MKPSTRKKFLIDVTYSESETAVRRQIDLLFDAALERCLGLTDTEAILIWLTYSHECGSGFLAITKESAKEGIDWFLKTYED